MVANRSDDFGVLGVFVRFHQYRLQPLFHPPLIRRVMVHVAVAFGEHPLQHHDVGVQILDDRPLSSLMVQPAAERSALASASSNACSTFRVGRPSILEDAAGEDVFLPVLDGQQALSGWRRTGMAWTRSQVMPGCISPLKRTSTDSGMSSGITPVAANATRPEPAGKEMPMGKRVGVTTGTHGIRQQHAVQPEWMTPSPGRRETPPRFAMKSGRVWWV